MSEASLVAEERTASGKGAARKLRAAGRIPVVLYGPGKEGRSLQLDPDALEQLLRASTSGINTLIDLKVGGEETVVLVKEIQREPVRGQWIHADLYEVDLQKKIEVSVPLHFVGKSQGVELGGLLDHPVRELQFECLPQSIPEFVEVDVSELDIGDSVHVRDLAVPEGATLLSDGELTVASCNAPRAEEEEAPEVEGEEGVVAEGEEAEGEEAAPKPEEDASSEGGS